MLTCARDASRMGTLNGISTVSFLVCHKARAQSHVVPSHSAPPNTIPESTKSNVTLEGIQSLQAIECLTLRQVRGLKRSQKETVRTLMEKGELRDEEPKEELANVAAYVSEKCRTVGAQKRDPSVAHQNLLLRAKLSKQSEELRKLHAENRAHTTKCYSKDVIKTVLQAKLLFLFTYPKLHKDVRTAPNSLYKLGGLIFGEMTIDDQRLGGVFMPRKFRY